MSLLNVNSSENKSNDNIPFVPEEKKSFGSNKENDFEKEDEGKEGEDEENEEEKLSESMSLNKKNGGEVDLSLLVKNLFDEIDNSKNSNDIFNDKNDFNNLNNEEENSMKHGNNISNYDLNVSEMQKDINKNEDKEFEIYDKFDINKVKGQKGIKNDKTDLSGLGKKKQETKEETPNCCGVCMKAFCG